MESGQRVAPGALAQTLFQALADVYINIELISTSEIKISIVIDQARARAVS